jgi:ubiquinone/menaquinone biosynthesis C-methylase UbiE
VNPNAAFFIPYLHSGMSLLDCGCGPGTITSGLAQVVAPGHVKGVDIDEGQISLAIDYANKQGISNVSYQLASVYEMPFEDNSFDAAFGHTIIQHLNDPLAGLKEIHTIKVMLKL